MNYEEVEAESLQMLKRLGFVSNVPVVGADMGEGEPVYVTREGVAVLLRCVAGMLTELAGEV
jgi:hypothetical protein